MGKSLNQAKANAVRYTKKKVEHWQVVSLALAGYDAVSIVIAFFLALWFRFDCRYSMIPKEFLGAYLKFIGIYVIFSLFVFWRLRLYNSIWRFASYSELVRMIVATGISSLFHCTGMTLFFGRMPLSYYFFGTVIQFGMTLMVRFAYRFVLLERSKRRKTEEIAKAKRVLLIGGGKAGQIILRDIKTAKELKDIVCCIIDDNPNKWGRYIEGVPIVGGRDDILSCVERYKIDKIIVAVPSATAEEKRDILNICKETGCELKNLPGVYQFLTGEVKVSALRDVDVEELLGRDPIKVNMEEIHAFIHGKKVMVTGGGGSIGSGLCRQIASYQPKQLIVFDIYENNAYDIQQELKKKYPMLHLETLIGSVRNTKRIESVMELYRPDIVYHAAAHKHVPLMEDSPNEAIKNNVFGTYKTARAADKYGVKKFVLISTDKAVNPTNIMGASKRMCEMIIQTFSRYSNTEFVAVRFGNVLGSNGSVIPLFKKQMAAGGPVTVTHPDIIRYFMTIPEAVSLVLQAGAYAKGGEIFVLDMGEPVKIADLAKNLIRLSGYTLGVDMEIKYTGLRPGEKLYEELLTKEEGLQKTENELIYIGKPLEFDEVHFLSELRKLEQAAIDERFDVKEIVSGIVPTYHIREEDKERDSAIYQEFCKLGRASHEGPVMEE